MNRRLRIMKEKEVFGHFSTFLENPRRSRLRYWNNIRNVFKPWKNVKNSFQTTLSHDWHSYKNPHAQHTIETTNAQHALKTTLFWKCISIKFPTGLFTTDLLKLLRNRPKTVPIWHFDPSFRVSKSESKLFSSNVRVHSAQNSHSRSFLSNSIFNFD